MRYGFATAFLLMIAGLNNPAVAQQPIFKNYTVNDGLISNSIRRIFQDKKGFLWIATWEGLSKYDGHTFSNYSTANGLSHNMINDFYEAANGQLFVALNNGAIDIFNGSQVLKNAVPGNVTVNRFISSAKHRVLVTTDRTGLQEFVQGKLVKPVQTFPTHTYSDLAWLSDSVFITSGENSIKVFNRHYQLLAQLNEGADKYSEIKIYQDSKKRIWAGSFAGLKSLSFLPGLHSAITFTSLPAPFNIAALQHKRINDIFEDAAGTLWFGTTDGLVKINADGSHQLLTVKDGLSSNIVTSIFQDKENNIWFGTAVGLSKLVTRSAISLYPVENGVWSNDNLYLLYPFKKNHFLVSTFRGMMVFNKQTGKFKPVANAGNEKYYGMAANTKPPLLTGIHNMSTFDPLTFKFNKNIPWPVKGVSRIAGDEKGNFFLGDIEQLLFSSGKTIEKILDSRISSLIIDRQGQVWAGTWQNGLFRIRYRFTDNKLVIEAKDHFLPDENIRCLFEDSKGNIWAGTRYQGVYQLIKKEKDSISITHFDQRKGLTSNFIKTIRQDAKGNIWVAFYQGLDKIINTDSGFRVYNFSKVNNYFASVIGLETDEDNSLWLATGEGLSHITDGEMEKLAPLPVYITRVYSPDSTYAPDRNKTALSYRQNQLQFEFSAPGFINEKQVLYSYRLTGSAYPQWTAATNQHTVSYASLRQGSYIFEVRTLGWNGNWGKPAAFNFIIDPPFWQTWWFISIAFFCGLLFIYRFVKWREKDIKTMAKEKLKVQQLNAAQLKNKLELEQIINYFSTSLIDKNKVEEVLWDVAKNLIGRLGFVDCMIYLWNADKTKMIQKAGFGPKGSIEEINEQPFDALPGQGVVGYVMQTKEPVLIPDTSVDPRYRPDEMQRLSEITVPVIYNNELIGVIDSEHPEKNFYTTRHLQVLTTIATLMANKIKSIETEQLLQQTNIEMYSMNEQLLKARLEALRAQMNPHFIFNCLTSIDNLIQMDEKEKATLYLSKFAKLIRSILENAASDTVPCWKDMVTLQLYLELEALRFDNKFTYQLTIADEILHGDYKVPPLIIQPFVENAIHHGLLNKIEGDKQLLIIVSVANNHIHYLIEDNGVGRAKANSYKQLNKSSHQSMGMQITTDRINLFNQNKNGFVRITDMVNESQQPCGTKVAIELINQP